MSDLDLLLVVGYGLGADGLGTEHAGLVIIILSVSLPACRMLLACLTMTWLFFVDMDLSTLLDMHGLADMLIGNCMVHIFRRHVL
jgi:hypothetical protein